MTVGICKPIKCLHHMLVDQWKRLPGGDLFGVWHSHIWPQLTPPTHIPPLVGLFHIMGLLMKIPPRRTSIKKVVERRIVSCIGLAKVLSMTGYTNTIFAYKINTICPSTIMNLSTINIPIRSHIPAYQGQTAALPPGIHIKFGRTPGTLLGEIKLHGRENRT